MTILKHLNFEKLRAGLTKTRERFIGKLTETLTGKAKVNSQTLEELEEILISADVGLETTQKIIEDTQAALKDESDRSTNNILETIKQDLTKALLTSATSSDFEFEKFKPFIILIIGVNGAGKTTTIGKLAYNFRNAGLNVVVGAADTFRAAANEQLEVWAERAGVIMLKNLNTKDPSAVAFETVNYAKENNADVVLIDTAGRLHSKSHLMEELKKIKRVINKSLPHAPNEILLVIDGNTGQNALIQAQKFSKFTNVTGLIITKLDGTAKGGVLFQICSKLNIPVRYIGVGEKIDDLQNFDPQLFVSALFQEN